MQRRFALLGCSRGLGWATFQELQKKQYVTAFLLSSRKIQERQIEISQSTQNATTEILYVNQDFSKLPIDPQFLNTLQKFAPTDLIYFAGGGPYGKFAEKKWSDHQWALNTTFLYPAQLVHSIAENQKTHWSSLRNIIFIGSAIAESRPDPKAASYAAAKHALKGLIDTLQLELDSASGLSLHLFSPGYMQTDLLPPHSEPRQKQLAENPFEVAKKLIAVIEKND